jgi:hypothetical protein
MAKDQIDELEKKKQELEDELHKIQGELDNSLDQVRDDVSSSMSPKSIIRKYPLPVVGASALLGFLVGHKGKSPSGKSSSREFSGALLAELKRLATRKAISFATDYVEDLLEEKASEHLSTSNGEEES